MKSHDTNEKVRSALRAAQLPEGAERMTIEINGVEQPVSVHDYVRIKLHRGEDKATEWVYNTAGLVQLLLANRDNVLLDAAQEL